MNTAVITGGTGGIGEGLVRAFAREGWRTAFIYHSNEEKAAELSREQGALPLKADLAEESECLRAFDEAMAQLGHLDCLIHCAGLDWQGLLSEMETAAWDRLMAVNVRSAFILSREALKRMKDTGGGSLLFISSIQAVGASCESAYAASKAALEGLCRSLAREWGPCGIRVNCLAPGVIDAGMMRAFSAEDREALRQETPLERLGTPEDVAEAALFLSGARASFITGQVLGVAGGLVL